MTLSLVLLLLLLTSDTAFWAEEEIATDTDTVTSNVNDGGSGTSHRASEVDENNSNHLKYLVFALLC